MRLNYILFIAAIAFSLSSKAQIFSALYKFDSVKTTTGIIDPTPVPIAAGVIFGNFSAVGTPPGPNASGRFSFTGWPTGATDGNDSYFSYTGSIDTTKYYEVTITPAPHYTLNLDSIKFSVRRSGTGIRTYSVRSSLDGFTSNISASIMPANPNLSIQTGNVFFLNSDVATNSISQDGSKITLDGGGFSGLLTPVKFRFYGWNAESSIGSFSIDNVSINGKAVLNLQIIATNITCNGLSDGSATAVLTNEATPYTYLWTPGGGDSATVTGLSAGTYTCTVTNGGGDTLIQTITIHEPDVISSSITSQTNVSCNGGNNGAVIISASGGTGTLNYLWSPVGGTAAAANGLSAATYICTITDSNSCTKIQNVIITQPNVLSASASVITNASCFNNDGSASITTPTGGTAPYFYLWSNNETTQGISGVSAGLYYITVTDFKGCTLLDTVIINNSSVPPAPSICMVTVDSFSINNEIYWDKTLPEYSIADSFIVYRYDVISSGYLRIGAVSKNSLSMFTDTSRSIGGPNGGDPQYSSYQYKLAVLDTCGNLSPKSLYHQSVFIQQPGAGSSFSWNAYTIEGMSSVSGYQFMRDDNGTGIWNVLVNTSGLATTDPNYASFPNGKWRVQALGLSCSPTRTTVNTSRSNIKHTSTVTGILPAKGTENLEAIAIYPNPANESITIELSPQAGIISFKIINMLGQLKEDETIVPSSATKTLKEINVSGYAKGIYTVCIENNEKKIFKKLVVN